MPNFEPGAFCMQNRYSVTELQHFLPEPLHPSVCRRLEGLNSQPFSAVSTSQATSKPLTLVSQVCHKAHPARVLRGCIPSERVPLGGGGVERVWDLWQPLPPDSNLRVRPRSPTQRPSPLHQQNSRRRGEQTCCSPLKEEDKQRR